MPRTAGEWAPASLCMPREAFNIQRLSFAILHVASVCSTSNTSNVVILSNLYIQPWLGWFWQRPKHICIIDRPGHIPLSLIERLNPKAKRATWGREGA